MLTTEAPARASGVAKDVQRNHPHAAYDRAEWNVIAQAEGDVFSRAADALRRALSE